MNIAFLGTPAFALPSLYMLHEAGHALTVFTQPDKPVGRKAVLTPPPVKTAAQALGLTVYQPMRMRADGAAMLREAAPELMVTAAFGQILSADNLSVPPFGCINVHGSLLPKYRGAAPIQWAVINGEETTGITTMLTDVGLDTGDILLMEELRIDPDETAGELYERMARLGAKVLKETIAALEAGALTPTPQRHEAATKCVQLKKEDGRLAFDQPAKAVHNRVRGVNPWPGAYAALSGAPLKLWRTKLSQEALPQSARPGLLYGDEKQGLFVCCQDAPLEILELQAPGGKRLCARDYLRGRPLARSVLS